MHNKDETRKRSEPKLPQEKPDLRNLVQTSLDRDHAEIEKKYQGDDKKIKEMKLKTRVYKYIGETGRSVFERSAEHLYDADQLKPASHILRHFIDKHEGENREEMEFRIKVLKYAKTSFERQIGESVLIQEHRKFHFLLNSKSEYNRCALPRLVTRMGEKEVKKWKEKEDAEIWKEEELAEKIRNLRKNRNKERQVTRYPAAKRRKLSEDSYENGGRDTTKDGSEAKIYEKRKDMEDMEEDQPAQKKVKRNLQYDIRKYIKDQCTSDSEMNKGSETRLPGAVPQPNLVIL